MRAIRNEGEASGSTLGICRHVDVLDAAELAKDTKQSVPADLKVDVVNEELRECAQVLVASGVGRLLLSDVVAQLGKLLSWVYDHHLTARQGCVSLRLSRILKIGGRTAATAPPLLLLKRRRVAQTPLAFLPLGRVFFTGPA